MKKIFLTLGISLCVLFILTACDHDDIEPMGTFYSLQAAYDEGLLTVDDLQTIANYRNNNIEYPDALDKEIAQAIKESRAEIIRTRDSSPHPEATAADVSIKYYGTYNDSVAIVLNDSFTEYPAVEQEETIAGVKFVYSGAKITIWKAH